MNRSVGASQRPTFDVLGYALVARGCALVMAGASDDGTDDDITERTWSDDADRALVLPSRAAALSLAIAIDAGPDVEIRTVVAERKHMKKREIRNVAAAMADQLTAMAGDAVLAREAWIDVGASNAGWKRRAKGAPAKAKIRKGVRKAGAR